ncbi:hypothetical protein RFI_11279, partial [Reticulomyxa filosa]
KKKKKRNFQNTCQFKRIVARLFALHMDPHRYAQTLETFRKWDKDGNGEISLEEFREGMKATTKLDDEEIDRIFKNLDVDDGRSITIDELVISSAFDALVAVDERLYDLFVEMDENGDGKLDSQELKHAMEKFGANVADFKRVESILKEIDENGDGEIDYEEFLHALHPAINEAGQSTMVKTRSRGFTLNHKTYDNFLKRTKKSELVKFHFDTSLLIGSLNSYSSGEKVANRPNGANDADDEQLWDPKELEMKHPPLVKMEDEEKEAGAKQNSTLIQTSSPNNTTEATPNSNNNNTANDQTPKASTNDSIKTDAAPPKRRNTGAYQEARQDKQTFLRNRPDPVATFTNERRRSTLRDEMPTYVPPASQCCTVL